MKKITLLLITALFILSCTPHKVRKDDSILEFENFSTKNKMPILPASASTTVGDTFDISTSDNPHADSLSSETMKFLYEKSYRAHHKKSNKDFLKMKLEIRGDTSYHLPKHFPNKGIVLGNIQLTNKLKAYVISFEEYNYIFINSTAFYTYLFVTNENRLTSVVKLCEAFNLNENKENLQRSFKVSKNQFVYFYATDMTATDKDYKKNGKYISYSTFVIDDLGFIKQDWIKRSVINKLIDGANKWKYTEFRHPTM